MQNIALILLGAGDSSRFKSTNGIKTRLPKKQWLRIGEIPLWLKVAKELAFAYPFCKLILSAHKDEINYMQKYLDSLNLDFKLTQGGKTRQESLQNAIELLDDSVDYVFVSDIARCNVSQSLCKRILETCKQNPQCAVPYLNINDTIAYCDEKPLYLKREFLKIIQTPQLSHLNTLKEALKKGEFTDESSAIYANGGTITYILGEKNAKKLTFLEDLQDLSLQAPSPHTLIGSGSDIHALEKGAGIILGGISIPCSYRLIAHSDGDVCLHALSDAILGAIGAGDIGEWFPDNDMAYKNADSKELLKKIINFVYDVGYSIRQADITIFAQSPKLSPYKRDMEKKIAEILEIPLFKVNLKATTTEKMGFIGRSEGILTQANVVLEYFNWKT